MIKFKDPERAFRDYKIVFDAVNPTLKYKLQYRSNIQ